MRRKGKEGKFPITFSHGALTVSQKTKFTCPILVQILIEVSELLLLKVFLEFKLIQKI